MPIIKNKAYEINSTGLLFKLTSDATQEVNLDDDEKRQFQSRMGR